MARPTVVAFPFVCRLQPAAQYRLCTTSKADQGAAQVGAENGEKSHLDSASPAPQVRKSFSSAPKFRLKDSEVNEKNIPSAAEIKEMLPSREELLEQLPTKSEIDNMYGLRNKGAGRAPPLPDWLQKQKLGDRSIAPGASESGVLARVVGFFSFFKDDQQEYVTKALREADEREAAEKAAAKSPTGLKPLHDEPLWPDCDTVEDILKEESFSGGSGSAEEEGVTESDKGEYFALACKALLYGSVLAVVFVSILSAAVSYFYLGFTSLEQAREYLRGRKERDMAQLREKIRIENAKNNSGSEEEDDLEIHQYTVDLTNPTELWEQLTGLMTLLEEIAEEQAREDANAIAKPLPLTAPSLGTTTAAMANSGATSQHASSKPAKKPFVLP